MTPSVETELCDGCGINTAMDEIDHNELCNECMNIVNSLQKDPAIVKRLIALSKIDVDVDNITGKNKNTEHFTGLPDVLDAVRFRTKDRDANSWYVSVSEINGQPVEVFASTAFDRDQHLQSRISNLTTITRLISLILRHIFLGEVLTLEKTIKQLHRSSRQQNDLPDMLTRVLSKYSKQRKSSE